MEKVRNLNFVVFYCIVFVVFGLIIGAFFGESTEQMSVDDIRPVNPNVPDQRSAWRRAWDGLVGIVATIWNALMFLFRALTMDIPGLPWYLRMLIISPLHVGMGYVILTHMPKIGGSGT